ncbi:hypothetical protein RRG08_053605 [Elysia crispata]|uniref:Receptor ligand binding region domain-containing protein n=1 Tax=Elysia crispata TaxID=231223 RepID=A0AAE1CR20_9GAST|nr:hypothetical protein RRG08_053605 [Elysia crispata]
MFISPYPVKPVFISQYPMKIMFISLYLVRPLFISTYPVKPVFISPYPVKPVFISPNTGKLVFKSLYPKKPVFISISSEAYVYLYIHEAYVYISTTREAYVYFFTPSEAYVYISTPSEAYVYISTPSEAYVYLFTPSEAYVYISTPSEAYIYLFTPSEAYVYISSHPVKPIFISSHPASEFAQDRRNESVMAFQNALLLVGRPITNPDYKTWESRVRELLYRPPINLEKNDLDDILGIKVNIPLFAAYLYDSVLLYARALHEALLTGGTPDDGALVFDKIKDRTFLSVQGHEVYIDHNGDAEANFTVLALRPAQNQFGRGLLPVGRFARNPLNRQDVTYVADVDIYGANVPLDEPECGYSGELCLGEASILVYAVGGFLGGVGLVLIIVLGVLYRNWRYEQELASLIWKIDTREIHLQPDAAISALSMISNNGVSV